MSKKAAFFGLACAVSFALGILLRDVKILDIWKSNTALTGVFFLFIGILLREYKNVCLSIVKSKVCLVISAIAYFGISILVYPAQSMDFHNAEYDNLLLCIFLIILGTIFCICLALAISELSPLKPIITFGQNTLVVYLLHFIIVGEIKNILNHFSIDMSFGLSLIVAVATCTIGTIISLISDRFCPILIGKRK